MFKRLYDKLGNDHIRSLVLTTAERLGMRKDIIRMDTNNNCNIRCIMCNQANTCVKKQFMPLHEYKAIIDIFAPTTRILYLSCGYEPLVTPCFTEYLKHAKLKGIPHISFCTNALLMNNDIISCLVEQEINEIIISFNGFCQEDYNRIMKGSDFERVCMNIKALSEYKQKHNTVKPHIRLNTILLRSNLLHFESMFRFLLENNIDTIQFRELMLLEGQNDSHEVEKELISNLSEEEYEQIALKIKDMATQLRVAGKEIILPSVFNGYTAQKSEDGSVHTKADISIQKKHNTQKQSCSIPYFSYWIDWTGDVRICGYDEHSIIGNVLSQDFKSLKAKRREFQKMALAGECSCELCTINVDSSTIV